MQIEPTNRQQAFTSWSPFLLWKMPGHLWGALAGLPGRCLESGIFIYLQLANGWGAFFWGTFFLSPDGCTKLSFHCRGICHFRSCGLARAFQVSQLFARRAIRSLCLDLGFTRGYPRNCHAWNTNQWLRFLSRTICAWGERACGLCGGERPHGIETQVAKRDDLQVLGASWKAEKAGLLKS